MAQLSVQAGHDRLVAQRARARAGRQPALADLLQRRFTKRLTLVFQKNASCKFTHYAVVLPFLWGDCDGTKTD